MFHWIIIVPIGYLIYLWLLISPLMSLLVIITTIFFGIKYVNHSLKFTTKLLWKIPIIFIGCLLIWPIALYMNISDCVRNEKIYRKNHKK